MIFLSYPHISTQHRMISSLLNEYAMSQSIVWKKLRANFDWCHDKMSRHHIIGLVANTQSLHIHKDDVQPWKTIIFWSIAIAINHILVFLVSTMVMAVEQLLI